MMPEPQTPVGVGAPGLVGPDLAADRAVPQLERLGVDPNALDRARRGALPARDLRALERRSGRAGRGQQPVAVAKHDLGVRAHVDDQVDDLLVVRGLRQDHAGGVGADVARDQRQRIDPGAGVDADGEVARRHRERVIGDERERRPAQLRRVEAEHEVVHDRVADDDQLEDVLTRGVGVRAELSHQLVETGADRGRQLHLAAGVHHHVAHPAHQILAKADLRVHRAGAGEHLAGVQIAEMPGHGGGADIEGHPERDVVEPGEDRGDQRFVSHGDGGGPVAGAKRLLQVGQHDRIDLEADERPVALERVEHPLQIARRVFERGLLDLDVVEPHDRIDLDRVGVGLLPHDLAVDLGLGRHVDQQIAADLRVTPEPAILGEAIAFAVALLRLGERDQVVGRARDPVLRERPRHRHHLAAAADPAPATDRVEVDAQRTGGVEHARTVGHLAAPPRGGEDDGVHDSACVPSRAERPPRRRPVASVPARSE